MQIHRHINIDELLPPHLRDLPDWKKVLIFDYRTLDIARASRDRWGPIFMNDDLWGGDNIWRGYRDAQCTIGADLSQHRFARAIDMKFGGVTTEEAREDIRLNQTMWMALGVTRVEEDTSWLHLDCGYTGLEEILFFED